MKQLKDYLHLYLPYNLQCLRKGEGDDNYFEMTGMLWDSTEKIWAVYFEIEQNDCSVLEDVFPILRPLSDMTVEEDNHRNTGFATAFLLSKHFDIFELIEAGLAIDKTTLK